MCGSQPALIHIHNVYSPSPRHRTALETPVIDELTARLRAAPSVHHVVTGDFNLHHPSWGGQQCLTQHAAADSLLHTAAAAGLQLALPPGMITWRARNLESTIDLMFVSAALTPRITACGVAEHLEQSSDHRPILTHLDLATVANPP